MMEVFGGLFAPLVILLILVIVSERFVRGVIEALQELRSLIQ